MTKHLYESTSKHSEVKSFLKEKFNLFIESLNEQELEELSYLEKKNNNIKNKLKEVFLYKNTSKVDIAIRNQIAFSKGKILALKNISEEYNLISSKEVCDILNISRQALSKKVSKGQILSYSLNDKKKFYPEFQFKKNCVIEEIEKLTKELNLDYKDPKNHNIILIFLTRKINFSDIGEKDNIKSMGSLLTNKDAFKIIVRNFKNRGSM